MKIFALWETQACGVAKTKTVNGIYLIFSQRWKC